MTDLHITGHGDAALFLGVEPRFSIVDALENVHRLDRAVLQCARGPRQVRRRRAGVARAAVRCGIRSRTDLRSLLDRLSAQYHVRDPRYAAVRSRRRGRDRPGVGGHARGQPGTADGAPRRAGRRAAAAALRQGQGRRRSSADTMRAPISGRRTSSASSACRCGPCCRATTGVRSRPPTSAGRSCRTTNSRLAAADRSSLRASSPGGRLKRPRSASRTRRRASWRLLLNHAPLLKSSTSGRSARLAISGGQEPHPRAAAQPAEPRAAQPGPARGGGAGAPLGHRRRCWRRKRRRRRSASTSAKHHHRRSQRAVRPRPARGAARWTRRSRTSSSTGTTRSTSKRTACSSPVDAVFKDDRHLMRIIERIVSTVGRRIDESSPMVDARLLDGSRVNAVIPPLALDGPVLSIRRFRTDKLGADDLVQQPLDHRADDGVPQGRRRVPAEHHHLRRHGRGQDDAAERAVELHLATRNASSPSRTRPN